MNFGILISNPNHHLELTECLASELQSQGHVVQYISLCRLRRLPDPTERVASLGIPQAVLPIQLKNSKPSTGAQALGGAASRKRKLLQWLVWNLVIKAFVKKQSNGLDTVLLMNDEAFPYNYIINYLKGSTISTVLLQEGIRFDLPNEGGNMGYGSSADRVFAWGEKSAQLFRARRIGKEHTVFVTGSPRFDKQRELYSSYGTGNKVLGIFTNPIDDQGFLSTNEKHMLVEKLIEQLSEEASALGIRIELKPHPREDIERYRHELEKFHVHVLSCSIHEAIERAGAGIVFASTVGLELLAANRPIAQCAIPNYGYVFDYVSSGTAYPIEVGQPIQLAELLHGNPSKDYLGSHLFPGNACLRCVNNLLRVG